MDGFGSTHWSSTSPSLTRTAFLKLDNAASPLISIVLIGQIISHNACMQLWQCKHNWLCLFEAAGTLLQGDYCAQTTGAFLKTLPLNNWPESEHFTEIALMGNTVGQWYLAQYMQRENGIYWLPASLSLPCFAWYTIGVTLAVCIHLRKIKKTALDVCQRLKLKKKKQTEKT